MDQRRKLLSRISCSIYFKIVFAAVLGFLGIAAGIYVGFAIVGESHRPAVHRPNSAHEGLYLNFELGDLFPLENYTEANGQQSNFEQLLQGHESVLIFVVFGCEPCRDLLNYWDAELAPILRPDVQVVVCADKNHPNISEEYQPLLDDKRLIFVDRDLFSDKYHLTVWPTVIAIDHYGFVLHIQLGFGASIDQYIIDLFTTSNR